MRQSASRLPLALSRPILGCKRRGSEPTSRAAFADDTAPSDGEAHSEKTIISKLIDATMYMTADQKEDVRTKSAEHNAFEAVQKAANAAGAAGATLYFPPGAYRTDAISTLEKQYEGSVLIRSGNIF